MGDKYVISEEMAQEEFNNFCEAWELDNDEKSMNSEEKNDFSGIKNKIIKSIKLGRLELNEDETLTYTVSDKTKSKSGQKIIISRPNCAAYTEMDRYKDQQGMHKFIAMIAAMTKHAPAFYSDFDGIDMKPLMAVAQLFLAE